MSGRKAGSSQDLTSKELDMHASSSPSYARYTKEKNNVTKPQSIGIKALVNKDNAEENKMEPTLNPEH